MPIGIITNTMELSPPSEANKYKFPAFYETRRFITVYTRASSKHNNAAQILVNKLQ